MSSQSVSSKSANVISTDAPDYLNRAELDASIKARYGVEPKRADEYTIAEFGQLTGRRYDAAKDFLAEMCTAGAWSRRKCGNGYVYREVAS